MIPDTYVQLLLHSGFVHDVSLEVWEMLKEEISRNVIVLECEDIYGGTCWFPTTMLVTTRICTPEARESYRQAHSDENYTI